MSTTADLPPLPASPLEGPALLPYAELAEPITLEQAPTGTGLAAHVHTGLALAAFVACVIVRALDPTAIDSDLLFLLAGGVLGTAGTGARR